ncbi:MAG: tol-pal system protein YbgF [Candidatus Eisenbacteria bacterium]
MAHGWPLAASAVLALVLVAAPGCYSKRFRTIEESIAALSRQADSLAQAHERTRAELDATRAELATTVRSLRAGSETSVQEMGTRIEQLESRLEEQSQLLDELRQRARTRSLGLDSTAVGRSTTAQPPAAPSASGANRPGGTAMTPPASPAPVPGAGVRVDPTAAYDQAVVDFTQGRFPLALREFREFVGQYRTSDLADNAQYGVGESYYAQGQYDSAAVEYRLVIDDWPSGDKVPAALYKLGVTYQKMNQLPEARATYGTLIEKHPNSGEAKLAAERLRELGRR